MIFAADLEVKDRDRFAGKPVVDVGVKKAVHDPNGVIAQAVAAVESGVVPAAAPGGASGGRAGHQGRQERVASAPGSGSGS